MCLLLYPDAGCVCLLILITTLAVSCCSSQFNAKHSVLVFRSSSGSYEEIKAVFGIGQIYTVRVRILILSDSCHLSLPAVSPLHIWVSWPSAIC
jgi:hypothetical protein